MNSKSTDREAKIAESEILVEKYKTALRKNQVINDMKQGLGAEMLKNPRKVKIIKKTFGQKLLNFLRIIFNKF